MEVASCIQRCRPWNSKSKETKNRMCLWHRGTIQMAAALRRRLIHCLNCTPLFRKQSAAISPVALLPVKSLSTSRTIQSCIWCETRRDLSGREVVRALKRLGFLQGDQEGWPRPTLKSWCGRNCSKPFLIAPKTLQSTLREALITLEGLKSIL